jgi:hypothetical protein
MPSSVPPRKVKLYILLWVCEFDCHTRRTYFQFCDGPFMSSHTNLWIFWMIETSPHNLLNVPKRFQGSQKRPKYLVLAWKISHLMRYL